MRIATSWKPTGASIRLHHRMLTPIIAALALGQTIPATASVVFPCFPETPEDQPVRFLTHSVTFKLTEKGVDMESLSTFKNLSDKPISFQMLLPTRGAHCRKSQVDALVLSAYLDKGLVPWTTLSEVHKEPSSARKASGIWAATYELLNAVPVTIKPKQTRSMRVKWSAPIGIAGMDGLQRMVIYDTAGAANWDGTVGQVNVAIQYKTNLILQVFAALPDKQWQVGTNGAFFKKYDYSPPKKPHLIFTYYPQQF